MLPFVDFFRVQIRRFYVNYQCLKGNCLMVNIALGFEFFLFLNEHRKYICYSFYSDKIYNIYY